MRRSVLPAALVLSLAAPIRDGAIAVRLPKHARKELEAYLGCGLLW